MVERMDSPTNGAAARGERQRGLAGTLAAAYASDEAFIISLLVAFALVGTLLVAAGTADALEFWPLLGL